MEVGPGSTKIAELPNSEVTNTITTTDNNGLYTPINVHPNPYGISDKNPIVPNPEQTTVGQKMPSQNVYLEQSNLNNTQQQRLPSRHIPQDTTTYAQDQQVQPDYIPVQEHLKDYVREHDDMNTERIIVHEQKKSRAERIDQILNELQTPILVSLLYFIFTSPYISTIIFKKFSFLNIYSSDGNFNIYGLLLKSLLFGTSYYSFSYVTRLLSEF